MDRLSAGQGENSGPGSARCAKKTDETPENAGAPLCYSYQEKKERILDCILQHF